MYSIIIGITFAIIGNIQLDHADPGLTPLGQQNHKRKWLIVIVLAISFAFIGGITELGIYP